jgi:hypothetical protein
MDFIILSELQDLGQCWPSLLLYMCLDNSAIREKAC